MRSLALLIVLLLAGVLLTSCAPGPNSAASGGGDAAGFWTGLWQGFTALFTFVISLFNHNVNIYEVDNNGSWYNLGYILGVMMFWGGGGGGAAAGSRKR